MQEVHRRGPAEKRDQQQDEQHRDDHEGDAAVRSGDLARILRVEPRIARAEARREADERDAHESDGDGRNDLEKCIDSEKVIGRHRQALGQQAHRHDASPELRPQEIVQRNRRGADDPERPALG